MAASARTRAATRLFATAIGWAGLAALLALLILFAGPRLLGGHSYAVLSDSMRGAVDTGDQVIVMPQAASTLRPGQIAAFDDPSGSGQLLQHRVVRSELAQGRIEVTTRGDANTAIERWQVPADGEVGRVVARVPWAGYAFGRLGTTAGRIALPLIAVIAATALLLGAIWTGRGRGPAAAIAGVCVLAAALGTGGISGHLSSTTVNSGNQFSAADDFDDPGGG